MGVYVQYYLFFKAMLSFHMVVKHRSFTQAAQKLQTSKSSISKDVVWLENELGVKLLFRTTRQVNPTKVGLEFFQFCEKILLEASNAKSMTSRFQSEPFGKIRISAPYTFGSHKLLPILQDFLKQYPKMELDFYLNTENQEHALSKDEIDVSIIIARTPPENFAATKLMDISWKFCASPKYLISHSEITHPKDIQNHQCLTYRHRHTEQYILKLQSINGEEFNAHINSRIVCNSSEVLIKCAIDDFGLAYLPEYLISEQLKTNKLVTILDSWFLEKEIAYAIYKPNLFLLPKVKMLLKNLKTNF